jgi:hypothetical protein
MSKKKIAIIAVAVVVVIAAVVAAVVLSQPKNVEGTLEEIMAKVYAGIPAEELPMGLTNTPVDAEMVEYFLGTTEVKYKEALACEPMMSSVPHSVVLVRLHDAKDAEAAVAKIKESANPRKWFCVEAKNKIVESIGDLVILIMTDSEGQTSAEVAPRLKANFGGLK